MEPKIAVVGLGYVGLPVGLAFARKGFEVTGYDVNLQRVGELRDGIDRTNESSREELVQSRMKFTGDGTQLWSSNFFIVTVPTPIDDANRPDLSALIAASSTVGSVLKRGDVVVYESTVYPGATEEVCVPALERSTGLRCGRDFGVGYSPERINPGDSEHRFETIRKVVSGNDADTLEVVAKVYGSVVTAGVHRAPSIKVAEAAKVIENAQRDINIGFVNELSIIFRTMGIDTGDVLDAAETKWNFLRFRPGLVGGHCIGVDPYYLTFQAERYGHHAEVILSGRRVNHGMGARVAAECIKLLVKQGTRENGFRVNVLGLTFKENVPDIRNSRVVDIVRELGSAGIQVCIDDPLADPTLTEQEYGLKLTPMRQMQPADAVILAVNHKEIVAGGWQMVRSLLRPEGGIVLDVKSVLPRTAKPEKVVLWRP
jgi:UDP-N-acetyl-D-glucosamine/UDP-N-acetyl-D-galactosamine dehydrogenase